MKKIKMLLCWALALLLSATPVALCAFSADSGKLSLMVASDIHLESASLDIESDVPDSEADLYYRTGIQGQMEYESYAILRSLEASFQKSGASVLLVSGDITNGNIGDARAAASVFADMESQGKRVFVINGNHDVTDKSSEGSTSPEDFAEVYAEFGYSEALSRDENSLSYTADLGGGYRLLAVDSCIYGKNNGKISDGTMSWIVQQTQQAETDGVKLVGMMHHSILPHMSCYGLTGMLVENSDSVASALSDGGVKYVFTGHFHANDISQALSDSGNRIYDVMTGSLITYPNAYREVTFSPESVDITTSYIESIDTEHLPASFTAEQKQAITDDFCSYSKGYLYAGIDKWISKYLGSSEKICRLLKLDADGAFAGQLDKLMPYISDALTMPLYGETDSLDAIARLSGNSIPQSNYSSVSDIAATILCGIYSGDESIGKDSIEMKALTSALHAAAVYAFCGISAELSSGVLPSVAAALGFDPLTVMSRLAYATAGADEFMLKIVSPILSGITEDAYEPQDLNVSLEAYGCSSEETAGVPISFMQKLRTFFKSLTELFGVTFS